ncbi:hypothetical protein, partial [uncultured Selenomonas sp.]|uniref:hypothetical protein n=1 Tax=uncultured Selenomonas sp. TaxID=159275 RepID=UPI0028EF15BF
HRLHNKYDFVQSHEITSSLVYGRRFAAAELFFCERARNTHSRDKGQYTMFLCSPQVLDAHYCKGIQLAERRPLRTHSFKTVLFQAH